MFRSADIDYQSIKMGLVHIDKKYWVLAEKWLNNTITPSEEIEFSEWYNTNQDKEVLLPEGFAENEPALKERILQKINTLKDSQAVVIPIKRFSIIRVAAAAVILITLGAAAFLYLKNTSETTLAKTDNKQLINDVAPGGNKAVLTLADGSEIILDNAQNGALSQQGNTKILKLDAGQLSYKTDGTKTNGEVLYNTIATPRGGQYQIILPDGSTVWLNAASSLRFPTAFVGKQRTVELTGEAYFEVKPLSPPTGGEQKMPFIVHVNTPSGDGGMDVQVLGTHFNVMAYTEEDAVRTTLLEGAVKVTKGAAVGLLKPGQQAKLNKTAGNIKISEADVEEVMAWKNGLFLFNNEGIKTIMRQISRWYDVDISFEGNIPDKNFTGQISRNNNLSQVLKMLELTKEAHFKITGKNITVMP